jgi:8-oxo-dGTP pyrophosphatase MutT (NUDIX family)
MCSLFGDGGIEAEDEAEEEAEEEAKEEAGEEAGGEAIPQKYTVTREDLIDCFPVSIEHVRFYICSHSDDHLHLTPVTHRAGHISENALMAFASAAAVRLTSLKLA